MRSYVFEIFCTQSDKQTTTKVQKHNLTDRVITIQGILTECDVFRGCKLLAHPVRTV